MPAINKKRYDDNDFEEAKETINKTYTEYQGRFLQGGKPTRMHMEKITDAANGYTREEIYESHRINPKTGLTIEYEDHDKITANKDHPTPSLPLGGESQAAEGGANLQVELPPNTHMESTHNNPCLACNRNEKNKAAEPIAKNEATTDLAIIIIRTNTTPNLTKA